jgi:hypothetical protein
MDEKTLWKSNTGIFLKIYVKPRSRKRSFLEVSNDEIVVNLQSPAKDGKANTELLKKLSKLFHVSAGNVRIVSGHKSKMKTIFIEGILIEEVKAILQGI